jgi:hypothetical protein
VRGKSREKKRVEPEIAEGYTSTKFPWKMLAGSVQILEIGYFVQRRYSNINAY